MVSYKILRLSVIPLLIVPFAQLNAKEQSPEQKITPQKTSDEIINSCDEELISKYFRAENLLNLMFLAQCEQDKNQCTECKLSEEIWRKGGLENWYKNHKPSEKSIAGRLCNGIKSLIFKKNIDQLREERFQQTTIHLNNTELLETYDKYFHEYHRCAQLIYDCRISPFGPKITE